MGHRSDQYRDHRCRSDTNTVTADCMHWLVMVIGFTAAFWLANRFDRTEGMDE